MILTEKNFMVYAAHFYLNSNCETTEEFEEDLLRFKYLKKLFYNFENRGEIKERLVLNHIIILYNIFDAKACTKMLLLRLKNYYHILFPFLLYLNYLPNEIKGINNKDDVIRISDYTLDPVIVNKIRKIRENVQ